MGKNTDIASGASLYEVRVQGHLDDRWSDWIDDIEIITEGDGTTKLVARIPDQPALHGILARLRDLGIPVISVCCVDENGDRNALMRAVVQDRYGEPDVLQVRDIERPEAGEHEVLVRVHAAGVDAGVWHLVTGQPYLVRAMGFGLRRPKQATPGMDLAGEVAAVGTAVTRFQPGDHVYGVATGSFAEYVVAREDQLAMRPDGLNNTQAAAVPTSAATARMAVSDVARVQAGERVLVIGASGGVGTFAVQIAKAHGAHVTGVASTGKLDLVRSLGADDVINYTTEDIADRVPFDVILDIAGNRSLNHLRRALTERGCLVIVGGEGGGKWFGGIDRQLRAAVLSWFVPQTLRFFISQVHEQDLAALTEIIDSGAATPVIDRTFALDEAADAIRYLRAGEARGKVVITP